MSETKRGRPRIYKTEEDRKELLEKRREYQASLRKNNPEKVRQYREAYKEKHKEEIEQFNTLFRQVYRETKQQLSQKMKTSSCVMINV